MKRTLVLLLALFTLVGGLAGCGSDDDDGAVAGDEPEEQAGGDDFCRGYLDLTAGDPDPDAIRKVAATAPGEGKAALEAIADGAEEQGEDYFDGPDFGENFRKVGQVAADECADDTFDVSAKEYAFTGVPDSVDAGTIAVTLSNKGKEFHEFTVLRRKDGVDKSFDEILKLDEDEAKKFVEEKGGTFAEPGGSAPGLFDLGEAGDYVALCFIPVGSTPDAPEEQSGPPHFTQGMKVEFSVR